MAPIGMRISLLGPTYPFRGGIAHYTTALCNALRERGHEVDFISFKRQYPGFLFPGKDDRDPSESPLTAEDVAYILDPVNPVTWLKAALRVKRHRAEMLLMPWWVAYWAAPFAAVGSLVRKTAETKVVFQCHNVIEHESTALRKFLTRRALKRGHAFIVHSSADLRNLKKIMPLADIKQCSLPALDFAGKMGNEPVHDDRHTPSILFFGFVRRYKGLDVLLEAMPQIIRRTGASLVVAGEFWSQGKQQYVDRMNKLGIADHVTIHDRYIKNEEVVGFFREADVVVVPYRSATGTGIVPIAFSFGKPVVATAVGCLPDVVRDGETGFLVPPGDSASLADAVEKCLEGECLRTFRANITGRQGDLSWDKYIAIIESFIANEA